MVVGIGASAGGLKALQQFLGAVPVDSGMAFVVIMHLAPARESRVSELLQDRSPIQVVQVTGRTTVEANRIYVIPPGHDLVMRGRSVDLRERGERSDHAPVDLFFRTLAEACGSEAVGVILSGMGTDGTSGLRYIREAGGITAAQALKDSEYDSMPASAIATGLVDLVFPAAEIPAALLRLRTPVARAEAEGRTRAGGAAVADVLAELRKQTGHDFSQYKRATVLRRLNRRLQFNDVTTLQDYLPLVRAGSAECQALLRDLLISVSSFFRDPDAFEGLAAAAPALFDGKGPADTVRVWVVGCATGEEVYSIAMVLTEHAETLVQPPRLQLFATDIDEHGYAWARAGLYSAAAVASVSPERLTRFFVKEAHGYRVAKSLRASVLFAGHNVLHDPPFSRMDLVSCRNLFIYLQPEAQNRALENFHFSLKPGGMLFLGASESIGDSVQFVGVGDAKQRLYRRNLTPNRLAPRASAADLLPGANVAVGETSVPTAPSTSHFSYGAEHVRMLEQYAPTSIIVNERLDVVHLSAGAGRFLRMGEGEPSHNLMELADGDLRRALRTSLHHAFVKGAPTRRQVSTVNGSPIEVVVEVRPPEPDGAGAGRFALVLFETSTAGPPAPAARSEDGAAGPWRGAVEAEEELSRTRELLDSTSAAHDETVAELQTVNEELRSINEEQKAATEELETGREEIQSINEELTTINQEYQTTIEELKQTNADLQNLIESTEIGTIFLDSSLRIRRFTPAVSSLFNFVAADRGRSFADITHRLDYPDLVGDVARVLALQVRREHEAGSETGESYIVRISPYRSLGGGNHGVVLTFFNNTKQHRVEKELREATAIAEQANLAKGTFLSTLSHEFRTPLNAIIGYADLLPLDGPLNGAQEKKLERIKVGGWHLAGMIEDILSFAKLDGGQEVIEPEPADAGDLAREATELIETAAVKKGLEFNLDLPDTSVSLSTDAGKVRMILVNLCGNAVKFTESGAVRLAVRGDGDRVSFEVSDTGMGIAPEHHARIFDRFWQVDGGSTRSAGGLGIGLAAAREYARLLGGDVELERSERGQGATFCFWLPLVYEAPVIERSA
jgi:two-component system CheB/CheR fusion protein